MTSPFDINSPNHGSASADTNQNVIFEKQVPVWIFSSSKSYEGNRVILTIQLSTVSSHPQVLMKSDGFSSSSNHTSSFLSSSGSMHGSSSVKSNPEEKMVFTSSILKSKTLNVRLTNDSDLFFLYSVSIGMIVCLFS